MENNRIWKIGFFLLIGLAVMLAGCRENHRKKTEEGPVGQEKSRSLERTDDSLQMSATACNEKGKKMAAQGLYTEAVKWFSCAIKIDPQYDRAYYNRGLAKWYLKDNEGALADYNEAIRLNSTDADYYCNRCGPRINTGDYRGALSDAEAAIRIGPEKAEYYFNRGLAYEGLKEYAPAGENYRHTLELDSRMVKAYYRLACLLTEEGNEKAAVTLYVRALEVADGSTDPEIRAALYFNLGRLYYLRGKKNEAQQTVRKGVELYPQHELLKELLKAVSDE